MFRRTKGGIFKSCSRVPNLQIWLRRGWGNRLKVTLQTRASKISAHVDGGWAKPSSVRRRWARTPETGVRGFFPPFPPFFFFPFFPFFLFSFFSRFFLFFFIIILSSTFCLLSFVLHLLSLVFNFFSFLFCLSFVSCLPSSVRVAKSVKIYNRNNFRIKNFLKNMNEYIFKSTAYRLGTSKIDSSVWCLSVSDSSLNLRSERFGRQISLECSGMIQNTV